jgi:hypothetical protein
MLMEPRLAQANLVHDTVSKRQLRQCLSSDQKVRVTRRRNTAVRLWQPRGGPMPRSTTHG